MLIYLLDQGILKDLKFATFAFENNPQGKLMLSVLFGFSKYYVDNLSENVKRGNRAKVALGWRPNHVPLGYKNDRETKTTIKDSERFPIVRKMFDLALTDGYSVRRIAIETRTWGLMTPKRKRTGGKFLAVSNVYAILTNRFYAGVLEWNGERHPGAHEPMLTLDEFERVQRFLGRRGKPSPSKYFFPFTAFMRCGECSRMVTAENKVNRFGTRYVYYHCTRQRLDYRCKQRSVTPKIIDDAFVDFLRRHTVPEKIHDFAIKELRSGDKHRKTNNDVIQESVRRAVSDAESRLTNLTSLRIRDLIGEDEFTKERKNILDERFRLEQSLPSSNRTDQSFEPLESLLFFSNRAVIWYQQGDNFLKQKIIKSVASNPVLMDKIVSIEAKKGFSNMAEMCNRSKQLTALDEFTELYLNNDPEFMDLLQQVTAIVNEYREKEKRIE
jgi:hypothetical protein